MISRFLTSVLCLFPGLVFADAVVATRTVKATAIITELDVKVISGEIPGSFDAIHNVIGQEARTTLYAGRPVRFDDVGPPAIVARNQIVPLRFEASGLVIATEGRSLERGAAGDRVRIMNLASRKTLFGQVQPDGSVLVR
ncbi:flagellar basal body P-ring formation chaperone FlgA [uncultured Roseobacter sp.]|uniref:flagellar basal body P-ring formation chaperone FlgA n=1 Tax=uncultured Roseobacter sp. TaxID=114847 RepID=UPI0026079FF0|nr:flagellar basal body P-ring formation chaperone FlgA [uncultured Roseobacter sp.]